jgi:hypothetical protein
MKHQVKQNETKPHQNLLKKLRATAYTAKLPTTVIDPQLNYHENSDCKQKDNK